MKGENMNTCMEHGDHLSPQCLDCREEIVTDKKRILCRQLRLLAFILALMFALGYGIGAVERALDNQQTAYEYSLDVAEGAQK